MSVCSPPCSAPEKKGFVPLAAGVLRSLERVDVDMFFWNTKTDHEVLFRQAGTPLANDDIETLVAKCGDYLFVRQSDFKDVCGTLLGSLEDVMADEAISPEGRYQLLQTALTFEVDNCLRALEPTDYLSLVGRVGEQIRNLMGENRVLPTDLFAIARHDSHTFTHVTNVASYATVLAERLGITDHEELNQITVGAMLHDIGKRFIPGSILTKPGRLTEEERIIIQTHPLRGYEELSERGDLTHAQRMMVYQHHEHMDGNGYPVRVLGDEIHPWARLLSVVDVFDALTGRRPYRKPMRRSEAAEFIVSRAGTQFDKEMALCWVSAIKTS